MTGVKVLDLDNLPERGVLLVDAECVPEDKAIELLRSLPPGIRTLIPLYGGLDRDAVAIMSEAEMNRLGWFRDTNTSDHTGKPQPELNDINLEA